MNYFHLITLTTAAVHAFFFFFLNVETTLKIKL